MADVTESAVEIQAATVADLAAHCRHLFTAHAAEVSRTLHLAPLDPDFGSYRALEAAGHLLVFLAIDPNAGPVGYAVTEIGPHRHYRELTVASVAVVYVSPSHRKGVGRRLEEATAAAAKHRGAHLILQRAKPGTAGADAMERWGYRVLETVFSKEL